MHYTRKVGAARWKSVHYTRKVFALRWKRLDPLWLNHLCGDRTFLVYPRFFFARKLPRTPEHYIYIFLAENLENKMAIVAIFYVTRYLCGGVLNATFWEKLTFMNLKKI